MAITPNDLFTSGQILTATECNNFPRGVMALATSDTTYAVTTVDVIATGMTVTFTAEANRNYKVTYYEPTVFSPSPNVSYIALKIKTTNASGTQLVLTYVQTNNGGAFYQSNTASVIKTFSAGSVTLVGTASANTTTGLPSLDRAANSPAYIVVEDIGTA